jgi:hypothetical protein
MDLNDEIAKVAYELFERGGRQHGKDKENWSEAEEIVKARHAAPEKKAETRKAAPVSTPQKTTTEKTRSATQKAAAPKGAQPSVAGRMKKPTAK